MCRRAVRVTSIVIAVLIAGSFLSDLTGKAECTKYPFRLRLRLDRTTVNSGDGIGLVVELLDRDYNLVPTERSRTISFDQPSGDGLTGTARVYPAAVGINAGESQSNRATLKADRSGKLIIRANSDGLYSDQSYILVVGSKQSSLAAFLFPTAYADNDPMLEIEPGEQEIPANNTSQAQFTIFLIEGATSAAVKVQSNPPCKMRAGNNEGFGALMLTSTGTPASFERVFVSAKRPGKISITAEVLPHGPTATAQIDAVLPSPARVLFDLEDGATIRKGEDALLPIKLVDSDGIDITELDHPAQIRVTSPTDHDRVMFDKVHGEKTVQLSEHSPLAQVSFTLTGTPKARAIKVRAEDSTRAEVDAAVRTFTFEGELPPLGYLLLIAALAGVVGGLIKDFKKLRVKQILPRLTKGYLELGVIGNVPFSLALGLILFAAGRVGLIEWSSLLTHARDSQSEMQMLALLFGVIGGFGGTAVLERLLNRVLPAAQPGLKTHVATPQ